MDVGNGKPFEALSGVRPDRPVRHAAAEVRRALAAHSRPAAGPADPVLDPQVTNVRPMPKWTSLSHKPPGFFQLNCVTRQQSLLRSMTS